jgi:general secretion pathway protein J
MTSRARGFTLIELLLAISILAIIAVLGWRGLDSIVRSRETLTAGMDQTRGLQLAFAQMQSDCENMADSTLLRNRAFLQAEDNRITLVRMVMAENQPTRLQVVSYRVRDGVLTRRESLATRELTQLDSLWQAALGDTDSSVAAVALQSGVQGMAMRFWMPGSAAPRHRRRLAPRPAYRRRPPAPNLPTGLEVSLTQQARNPAGEVFPAGGTVKLKRQQGVAVVTALLLTTLAVTIVASLFWQQQVQVRSMENQRLQLQTRWIVRGALDLSRLILNQDVSDSPNLRSWVASGPRRWKKRGWTITWSASACRARTSTPRCPAAWRMRRALQSGQSGGQQCGRRDGSI